MNRNPISSLTGVVLGVTLVLSSTASLCADAPEGDFAAVLPNGTMAYLYIENVQRALDVDPDGDLMRLMKHDAVKRAFEELHEMLGLLEDEELLLGLDLTEEEVLRLFSGRVALAIPEIVLEESQVEARGNREARVELSLEIPQGGVVLADFSSTRDKFEELLENITKLVAEREDTNRAELVIDEFEGTRLYAIEVEDEGGEVEEPSWMALVGDVLVLANEVETAKSFIDLVKNGAPEGDRLLDDVRYLDAVERMGETHARFYFNLGEFLPLVNQLIRQGMDQLGTKAEQFVTTDDLIDGLRLDAFQSLFFGLRFADDEAGMVLGMTHDETERGISTLFAYADTGVEIPSYFSPEFHSGSITTLDLSRLYRNIEAMVKKISPYAHTVMMSQIASIEGEYGIALREAVLDNFEPMMVEFIGYPEESQAGAEDQPTQAYVIRVKDPQGLEESLAELADFTGGEDPTEFMNELVYRIEMPGGMIALGGGKEAYISYAVVESDLVISLGEAKMVENLIAHIKNPGESVLENSSVMDALDDLPSDDCVGLGFADVADVLSNAIRSGEMGLFFEASNERNSARRGKLEAAAKTLDELPDVSDLHYLMASKSYRTPESYLFRVLIRRDSSQP